MKKTLLFILLALAALTLFCGALAEDLPLDPYREEAMAHLLSGDVFPKGNTFTMTLSTPEDKVHPTWTATPKGDAGGCTFYFQLSHKDEMMANGLDLVATSHGYQDANTFSAQIVASGSYELRVWATDSAGASSYAKQSFDVSDPALPTLEARVKEIGDACKAAGCDTDFEKALWIHDWLTMNARYDNTYSNYGADGVLLRGTGVCDSYAGAYMHLLAYLGVSCKHVSGVGNGGSHAWNAVQLNGDWYWVDVTWDDPNDSEGPVSGYERHLYLGLPSAVFNVDHTPGATPDYTCDKYEENYFIHTGRVSIWTDLFSDDIAAALARGLYRPALAIPDYYPSEKTGFYSHGKEHIVYNVTAYALSAREWEAFGEDLRLDAAYDAEGKQMLATLRFGDRQLTLPSALTEISQETFTGDTALMSVTLGNGVTAIGANAFLGCTGLWRVYVPASVTSIDPTAFSGCPHVALAGPAGSYAESYAGKNKLSFVVE